MPEPTAHREDRRGDHFPGCESVTVTTDEPLVHWLGDIGPITVYTAGDQHVNVTFPMPALDPLTNSATYPQVRVCLTAENARALVAKVLNAMLGLDEDAAT